MLCRILLSLIVALAGLASPGYAQTSRFDYGIFVEDGDTLNYRILSPDYNPSGSYPLLLFLHGAGERGDDNEAQLKWGVQNLATDEMMKNYPCFVLAPQCPAEQWWSNFGDWESDSLTFQDSASPPMALTMALLDAAVRELPVDTTRIYITGLSMGGLGTFDAISRYPDRFAAAIPVCGGGDTTMVNTFKDIPLWIISGAEDVIVEPKLSMDMVRALQDAGAKPGFSLYPDTGHFSWLAAYSDPMIWAWLFRQRKADNGN